MMDLKPLDNYIPVDQCLHGHLYLIDSRNLRIGIYNENTKSFYGIRYKFGDRFIDDEYHFGLGVPFGTCKPLKMLEKCPIQFEGELIPIVEEWKEHMSKWRTQKIINYTQLFEWLDQKLVEFKN